MSKKSTKLEILNDIFEENGVTRDDTIRIVAGNINTEHFFLVAVRLLMETIDGIVQLSGKEAYDRDIVCVDGKESCGSKRRDTGEGEARGLHTLNVYAGDYGICIGQKFIEEKSNEIPAAIVKGKGDYVLALKGNQPLFYDEVREYFDKKAGRTAREGRLLVQNGGKGAWRGSRAGILYHRGCRVVQ